MIRNVIRNWFFPTQRGSAGRGRPLRRPPHRPALEALEDRLAPAASEIIGLSSVITPFRPRFSANDTGDIALIGNTLETASTLVSGSTSLQDIVNAQNGV